MNLDQIKKWIRTGSYTFAKNSIQGKNLSDKLETYTWRGKNIFYRPGTSDTGCIYEVLIRPKVILRSERSFFKNKKLEYWVPKEVNPSVILDIGGNIGVSSIYFSDYFPNANIFTFEPIKNNFDILSKNTKNISQINVFNVGLGKIDEMAEIFSCDDELNLGGFSLHAVGVKTDKKQTIQVKNSNSYLQELGIKSVDLIKIDTEGNEFDILTSMDPKLLSNAKWIIGELHGTKDFELLSYLSKWFDVDVNKSLSTRLFNFCARNKKFENQIPWKRN